MFPNTTLSFAAKTATPPFFRDGLYRRVLAPGEIVVPAGLPVGRSMLYQAQTDMYFRIPAGYFGSSPPDVKQRKAARALSSGHPPLLVEGQVRTFLRTTGVRAILVITDKRQRRKEWERFLGFLHVAPQEIGGVSVYRLRGTNGG
jgi:hypothetical protein